MHGVEEGGGGTDPINKNNLRHLIESHFNNVSTRAQFSPVLSTPSTHGPVFRTLQILGNGQVLGEEGKGWHGHCNVVDQMGFDHVRTGLEPPMVLILIIPKQ
uniref:Uncharacterized protein n=1 Tax=Cacopsylla melanoneura TaxID=428564 RepID=A0A8D8WFA8_9HEMI